MQLTDDELYEGIPAEQRERWQREAREMYDPARVEESNRRVRAMSKDQWTELQQKLVGATQEIAALMGRAPGDPAVQAAVARHHAVIERFYPAPADVYRGLGEMYAAHPEFRAFHEEITRGLADFMRDAMAHYSAHALGQLP